MKMFATERRNEILKILQEKQRLTVKDLSSKIGVSEATLRTDLNKMEMEGLLTRTHGGAILNDYIDYETSFSAREKKNKSEKIKIAEKAFTFVEEKQCILLDASSTALEFARFLKDQQVRLTVVTSGLQTALELKDNFNITVILIGGVVTTGSSSVEGTLGLSILNNVNIDIMFTSANGFVVETGLTDFNLYEVELKKEMVKKANNVIALIDKSKIGTSSSALFAYTEEIDTIITDQPIGNDINRKLSELSIRVIDASS
ncbi:DeoR/GlpR family DNA-binding transcription regulator [Aquibacillus sediminis]|uniref:DeoR/GlpR family DNA-binding transcription regulator n=1 Tax=Aquibacillus sediminis TaxID=2574734 RepID=UPI0011084EF8|nr:DeoR/GlpR family DNA-binding transcription regulator [Aquibacillus sediminis]